MGERLRWPPGVRLPSHSEFHVMQIRPAERQKPQHSRIGIQTHRKSVTDGTEMRYCLQVRTAKMHTTLAKKR
eukprot:4237944-Lingulodinium_polyedra.AAC.1